MFFLKKNKKVKLILVSMVSLGISKVQAMEAIPELLSEVRRVIIEEEKYFEWKQVNKVAEQYELQEAVKKGDLDIIRAILARGKDLETQDEYGMTALHAAASRGSTENCDEECNTAADPDKDLNPPNQFVRSYSSRTGGAWYAADYLKPGEGINHTGVYYFPVLEKLFAFADVAQTSVGVDKSMGMQPDSTIDSLRDQTLHVKDTPTDITTEESMKWSDVSKHDFIYQNNLYPVGDAREGYEVSKPDAYQFADVQVEPVYSNVSGSITQTLQTGK
jgi:hypothetical protein